MEGSSAEDAQTAEPAAARETTVGREVDQESEGRRHLHEVRIQEAVLEPDNAERSGETIEGHGSQGSHAGSLPPLEGVDPASGGQPPQTLAPDSLVSEETAGRGRSASTERHLEDVGQVQRSLNFMTGLLTSLTVRMNRVEQWQSATGSTAGGAASTAMTPVTPSAGALGWADVDRLNQQLAELRVGTEAESGPGVVMNRPLASTTKIFQGTFSSDSSETAMKRAAEGQRGVPGALMGPLALADHPFTLEGDPMQVDQAGDSSSMGLAMEQTVESVMKAQALADEVRMRHDYGCSGDAEAQNRGGTSEHLVELGAYGNFVCGRDPGVQVGGFGGEFGRYVGPEYAEYAQGSPITVAELAAPMSELILWQLGRHIHDMRRVPEQAAAADSSDEEQSQPGESDEDVDERREIAFQNALDGCEGL
ncbi:GIP [Symbiodinium necroappetens]|uniref:GIP protein n=1 Tax=Symbiodinium necroappetens TaxID=1628268 RepID=A0A812LWQ1_9DINO|nr:GIP [Symbiodinium necroappetens]